MRTSDLTAYRKIARCVFTDLEALPPLTAEGQDPLPCIQACAHFNSLNHRSSTNRPPSCRLKEVRYLRWWCCTSPSSQDHVFHVSSTFELQPSMQNPSGRTRSMLLDAKFGRQINERARLFYSGSRCKTSSSSISCLAVRLKKAIVTMARLTRTIRKHVC